MAVLAEAATVQQIMGGGWGWVVVVEVVEVDNLVVVVITVVEVVAWWCSAQVVGRAQPGLLTCSQHRVSAVVAVAVL